MRLPAALRPMKTAAWLRLNCARGFHGLVSRGQRLAGLARYTAAECVGLVPGGVDSAARGVAAGRAAAGVPGLQMPQPRLVPVPIPVPQRPPPPQPMLMPRPVPRSQGRLWCRCRAWRCRRPALCCRSCCGCWGGPYGAGVGLMPQSRIPWNGWFGWRAGIWPGSWFVQVVKP